MWRGRDEGRRDRARSPVWELRNSPDRRSPARRRDRDRDRYDRDSRGRRDQDSDRFTRRDRFDRDRRDRSRDRDRREHERSHERDRNRDRRRSPKRTEEYEQDELPSAPSPPKISEVESNVSSRSRSMSQDKDDMEIEDEKPDDSSLSLMSPGDWFCSTCGSYNFKRRNLCYRRNCQGKRSDGKIYTDNDKASENAAGISKILLFRRLDALTTEEKILETLKECCSSRLIDSISGITVGRETLTGASKCLAFINFNSISDSSAAHTELVKLDPPLQIDGRDVLVSFKVQQKTAPNSNYTNYYNQMANYSAPALYSSNQMSETDRVNAAAAVAQSAISAAQARMMAWSPASAKTFVHSTMQVAQPTAIPTGDGVTQYTAPDVRTFMYDETSGYYYDPSTGLYYDGTTQYFFNNHINEYMYWDATTSTYIKATQTQQNTDQPKLPNPPEATLENTIIKEPEEKKKKDKEDKVKVAKKIAKDMERWAKALNQKKENAKSNYVAEQTLDTSISKGSADIGFSVLGAGPSLVQREILQREPSPPPISSEDFLMKKGPDTCFDSDEGIIDWPKLTCLICKRKFPSPDVLNKHKTMSDLHKNNLAEFRKNDDPSSPQSNGYRDRAAERRMKFGEDEPIIRRKYEPPVMSTPMAAPPPSVVDTIGGKMLQKMGWSEGRGLGKLEQGRTAPVEAQGTTNLAGLGQKRGIYTPTPGETYRDTVKKLMIQRYKEVIGMEENK